MPGANALFLETVTEPAAGLDEVRADEDLLAGLDVLEDQLQRLHVLRRPVGVLKSSQAGPVAVGRGLRGGGGVLELGELATGRGEPLDLAACHERVVGVLPGEERRERGLAQPLLVELALGDAHRGADGLQRAGDDRLAEVALAPADHRRGAQPPEAADVGDLREHLALLAPVRRLRSLAAVGVLKDAEVDLERGEAAVVAVGEAQA